MLTMNPTYGYDESLKTRSGYPLRQFAGFFMPSLWRMIAENILNIGRPLLGFSESATYSVFSIDNLKNIKYYRGRVRSSNTSGYSAPVSYGDFLLSDFNFGGAENKTGASRIISRVLYHASSPRSLYGLKVILSKKVQDMTNQLIFKSHTLTPVIVNNQPYLGVQQIAVALGYGQRGCQNDTPLRKLYERHADEFTPEMSFLTTIDTKGGKQQVRIFSLRGCHLLAMFSKTPVAKEFRKWVLDLIERHKQIVSNSSTVEVAPHTRRLPSAPREIVLSEKAKTEIGGIVKTCTVAALKEVFAGLSRTEPLKLRKASNNKMDEKLLKLSEAIVEYGRSQYEDGMIHGILEGFFEGSKKN